MRCTLPPAAPVQLIAAMFVAGLAFSPSGAAAAVTVQKKPVVVERKTFDPDNKPAEMPPLNPEEAAVTTSQFDCVASVKVAARESKLRNGKSSMSYTIHGVKMTLELKVVVWNPTDASEKLKAHEEGHREIAETFYKTAERHAKAAAEKLDGRRIVGEGDTPEEAQKAADEKLREANQQVCETYMDLTSRAAVRVQNIYDEVTGHSTKAIAEKDAIQQAFARYAEEQKQAKEAAAKEAAAAKKPATRPTTRAAPRAAGRP